ncbi:hypothetical protein H4R20_000890 [Coemansia guatemalensis]|uniref:C3H1-type domain-containing protein n=1 Tax=Coemansia guatemalensis TaxID=2761395 RepID=A0A9W8HYC0_9FUNG|nr:hypothetical protein H4R20_000890 [Coemansia guatemalensis]
MTRSQSSQRPGTASGGRVRQRQHAGSFSSPSADNDGNTNNRDESETRRKTTPSDQSQDSTDESEHYGGRDRNGMHSGDGSSEKAWLQDAAGDSKHDASKPTGNNTKSRQRRRAQGTSGPVQEQTPKDSDSASRNGGGYNGDKCYFSHDLTVYERAVCKYFVKGNCKYGNKCALLHPGSNDNTNVTRSQKSSGGSARGGQSQRGAPAKGIRGALAAGGGKRDRRAPAEASYSDAAAGRTAGQHADHGMSSAPHSQHKSNGTSSAEDSASAAESGDGSAATNAWATGSLASALRGAELRTDSGVFGDGADHGVGTPQTGGSLSPQRVHMDGLWGSAADTTSAQSQPIPRASALGRAFGGGNGGAESGLSMQDSMLIDNLALSHSAAHQSFGGSPFMTSSIPLLDHFRETAGTSPHANSLTRNTQGLLLGRHAFTPIDAGAQASPHAGELLGRPLHASSLAHEPRSPLSFGAPAHMDSAGSPAHSLNDMRSLPYWAQMGGSPFQGAHSSPFANAVNGFGDATQPGAIRQRTKPSAPLSMFSLDGGGSARASSVASDNIDDLFELEQETPVQMRTPAINSNTGLAPNPQFISIEGFSRKLAGLSAQPAQPRRSIPGVSPIARPSF